MVIQVEQAVARLPSRCTAWHASRISAPDHFRGNKMLVIVPTPALVRYVSGVLPALGVPGVPVVTCFEWMRGQLRPHPAAPAAARDDRDPKRRGPPQEAPALLGVLASYVRDQAKELRTQLVAALPAQLPERDRILHIWDQTAGRPLRSRCRVLRNNLPSTLSAGLTVTLDELLRRLGRRARDVARDWSEVLTDAERLWQGFSAWPEVSGLPPVTRSGSHS